ncbi:hypothetical protein RvY_05343 [Ramazzottius varieornatus]|uniref:V-type proton ATPase subunit S1/VOA1 transmembrane domain-containing protein n=1 Tax=Ramazzottius varieornatus TaxID=947166 RepID=A0A1D1UUQ8_RAMVA|nr:hypothetical protein RvY_05343 [Ramazzottius varieornatus]
MLDRQLVLCLTRKMAMLDYFFLMFAALLWNGAQGITFKSLSEAQEEFLVRQLRRVTTDGDESRGTVTLEKGIFGNETIVLDEPDCFRMETTGMYVTAQNPTSSTKTLHEVLPVNPTLQATCEGTRGNGTVSVTIDFPATTGGNSSIRVATVHMTIESHQFQWMVTNLTMTLHFASTNNNTECDMVPLENRLWATPGNSYYCPDQYRYPFQTLGSRSETSCPLHLSLFVENLIMEPFYQNGTFSEVESCEYAFTTPLWMAVATALIMGVILFLGISMLASIKTMDRFDDPKTSKLLSVPNE